MSSPHDLEQGELGWPLFLKALGIYIYIYILYMDLPGKNLMQNKDSTINGHGFQSDLGPQTKIAQEEVCDTVTLQR